MCQRQDVNRTRRAREPYIWTPSTARALRIASASGRSIRRWYRIADTATADERQRMLDTKVSGIRSSYRRDVTRLV